MRGKRCSDPIGALAERQHGIVTRRQLVALGVDGSAIDRRTARGLLIPLHRGVFAVGHRHVTLEGRWLAAVLAAGDGAVLSHRDAAALHGMRKPPESRKVSVTTASAAKGTQRLWVYARRALHEEDVASVRGIPATSPARTLVDLAPMLTAGQLQATLGEADRRGLLEPAAVYRALRRTKGRHGPGHRRLTAALDAHRRRGITLLRSELEERFLDLTIDAGLPQPRLNAHAAGFEVDALWPTARLVVELDGWAHHKERQAAAWDREKSNRLQAAGYVVLRFMHADLVHRPAQIAAAISDALAR
ncbi:MAG: type IV toxin-antitoxin system AbiEi family antitoxin domain-containing protein [Actinobacteria bacterium]|nr:type IV toxin-antitoxin system AbiEi family antitoxin domain-containing protein [Actinomycetota bacterium]